MLGKKFRVQTHITWFVNAVHVSERSRNAEIGADSRKREMYVVHVLGLGVQAVVVDTSVINAIFFTTRDTYFHLEPDTQRRHAFEILGARRDILILWLLGKIEHVGREQGFLVDLVILFICVEHAIEPREELFGTVIRVQNHWTVNRIGGSRESEWGKDPCNQSQDIHSVGLGNDSDVMRSGDGASNGGLLFVVG